MKLFGLGFLALALCGADSAPPSKPASGPRPLPTFTGERRELIARQIVDVQQAVIQGNEATIESLRAQLQDKSAAEATAKAVAKYQQFLDMQRKADTVAANCSIGADIAWHCN